MKYVFLMAIRPYTFVAEKSMEGCYVMRPKVISGQCGSGQEEEYCRKLGKSKDKLKPMRTKWSLCLPLATSYFNGK